MKRIWINLQDKAFNFLFPSFAKSMADLSAKIDLKSDSSDYLPWNGSAMRPSMVQLISNEIIFGKRSAVLEIGTGLSTIILGKILKEIGGNLTTVDQDSVWQKEILQLASPALPIHPISANMKRQNIDGPCQIYFDQEELAQHLGGKKFDCLVVDAPIARRGQMSRYPAFPVFHRYLKEQFVVFLDDINRPDEAKIAKLWSKTFNLTLVESLIIGGCAILRPKDSDVRYNIF